MTMIASRITSLTVVYSIVYSDADQRKHQSSASLAFVCGIHRGPVNSPHKWPVTRKIFPFDDVIMLRIFYRIDDAFVNDLLILKHFCNNAHPVESLSACSFNLLNENFADIICRVAFYLIQMSNMAGISEHEIRLGSNNGVRVLRMNKWCATGRYFRYRFQMRRFSVSVAVDQMFVSLLRLWLFLHENGRYHVTRVIAVPTNRNGCIWCMICKWYPPIRLQLFCQTLNETAGIFCKWHFKYIFLKIMYGFSFRFD